MIFCKKLYHVDLTAIPAQYSISICLVNRASHYVSMNGKSGKLPERIPFPWYVYNKRPGGHPGLCYFRQPDWLILAGLFFAANEGFGHLPGNIISELFGGCFHQIGGWTDQWACNAPIHSDLCTAYGIDDHSR